MGALTAENPDQLIAQAGTWPQRAQSLEVVDAETNVLACEELLAVKELQAQAHARFDPICAKSHEAWQEALKQRRIVLEPLEVAEGIYKSEIAMFDAEQKRVAREEEARRLKAAEEVALLDREIEIEEAEAQGATPAEVTAIAERPILTAPVVHVPASAPKVAGISMRETWEAEVFDKLALIKFVAASPQYVNLLQPNMPGLNALARSLRSAANIPGVKVFAKSGVAGRR